MFEPKKSFVYKKKVRREIDAPLHSGCALEQTFCVPFENRIHSMETFLTLSHFSFSTWKTCNDYLKQQQFSTNFVYVKTMNTEKIEFTNRVDKNVNFTVKR